MNVSVPSPKQEPEDVTEVKTPPPSPNSVTWVDCYGVKLTSYHKAVITDGRWLDSEIILAAQKVLKCQFPQIAGLQDTMAVNNGSFQPMTDFVLYKCYT